MVRDIGLFGARFLLCYPETDNCGLPGRPSKMQRNRGSCDKSTTMYVCTCWAPCGFCFTEAVETGADCGRRRMDMYPMAAEVRAESYVVYGSDAAATSWGWKIDGWLEVGMEMEYE